MLKKLFPWMIILIAGLIIHWLNPLFFPQTMQLLQTGDIEGIAEYLRSFGIWAAVISILINIIINLIIGELSVLIINIIIISRLR